MQSTKGTIFANNTYAVAYNYASSNGDKVSFATQSSHVSNRLDCLANFRCSLNPSVFAPCFLSPRSQVLASGVSKYDATRADFCGSNVERSTKQMRSVILLVHLAACLVVVQLSSGIGAILFWFSAQRPQADDSGVEPGAHVLRQGVHRCLAFLLCLLFCSVSAVLCPVVVVDRIQTVALVQKCVDYQNSFPDQTVRFASRTLCFGCLRFLPWLTLSCMLIFVARVVFFNGRRSARSLGTSTRKSF